MTSYYVDTSALIKRYIAEPQGTVWLRNLVSPASGNIIVICEITAIELFAVFQAKYYAPKSPLTKADIAGLQSAFSQRYKSEYISVLLNEIVLHRAQQLVTKHRRLFALDAIHLACAIQFVNIFNEPIEFVSGDKDLLSAAQAEGFVVHDVETYP